ncbi:MAG: hypothetical protein AAFU85_12175 [Planctomycetota bacterium]
MAMSSKSQTTVGAQPSVEIESSLDWSELKVRLSDRPLADFHQWLEDDLNGLERELEQFASKQSRNRGRS